MNSVTWITFLSASICSSSSNLFLCVSLFSFLYLAALDFDDCSFSNVSFICFWTSSSEGDTEVTLLLFLISDVFFELSFWPTTSLDILLRFLLDFELSSSDSGFLNFSRSIFSPVFFKPESFSYLVWIFDFFSSLFESSSSTDDWIFSLFTIRSFGLSSFFLSRFISPTFLNWWKEDLDVIVPLLDFSSFSCSNLILNSSFSFCFSSIKSCNSTLLDLSELNSARSKSYWAWEILVVGLASISCPFDERNSTTLSREILNSLITLFNLILFTSLINFLQTLHSKFSLHQQ